ncbi:MAG: exodeoxyribonuclease V subunit alpha [Gammaproteobacteria bacterium]|nr:exodeoxyribonuclease V subunit alpha [Gammaproteobacteria bacterium]
MMDELLTFSPIDHALSQFLFARSSLVGEQREQLRSIILRLSAQLGAGDSCIPLSESERELMMHSGLLNEAGVAPLVMVNRRLYLYRYWAYEKGLAQQLKALVQSDFEIDDADALLEKYFPAIGARTDWQREAAKRALSNSLTIITGGPGTGKTTTVVKIVSMLQELAHQNKKRLNIALAAPTGKAAMRLQQSISHSTASLPCEPSVRESIPNRVFTIHRMLGAKRYSPYFHHRADNPLPYDLVVVDEASMVDLALMSKLLDALRVGAKLILLGDRNQLASVESGAVLADLIEALPEQTAELQESFRFDAGIKAVSEGVNRQQGAMVWDALQQGEYSNISLMDSHAVTVVERVYEKSLNYWQLIRDNGSFADIVAAFNQFQCLATNRVGSLGVTELNERIEGRLADAGFIERGEIGRWYRGRPVIVNRNIPELGLFNGDIGITLYDADGNLKVYFEGGGDDSVDASSDDCIATRHFIPSRIVHCETAYAMTVHKSQGSEFDEVLVVFPEVMNPVLTKELIYTAITRAKNGVQLAVSDEIWHATVGQRIERHSGLVEMLIH